MSDKFYKKLYKLTIVGGVAFWAVTFPFSLLPIAAVFRAALSISYVQMILVESLIGGMIISCCLNYILLRFFDKIPTKNPILKSAILGFAADKVIDYTKEDFIRSGVTYDVIFDAVGKSSFSGCMRFFFSLYIL